MSSLHSYVSDLLEKYPPRRLAGSIEHTLLKPASTRNDLEKVVEEAEHYGFSCIVVPPSMVGEAASITTLPVCTVVGFPLGYSPTEAKLVEAEQALGRGASHIDAVWNISAYKSGHRKYVREELGKLASLIHERGGVFKVIIETGLLTPSEIREASRIAVEAGADYVKTSTGFGPRGATLTDIILIKNTVKNKAKIKAAGGIRNALTALLMLDAGAHKIGASHSTQIMQSYQTLKQLTR